MIIRVTFLAVLSGYEEAEGVSDHRRDPAGSPGGLTLASPEVVGPRVLIGILLGAATYWALLRFPAGMPEETVWGMWVGGRAAWQVWTGLGVLVVIVATLVWRSGPSGPLQAAIGVGLGFCGLAIVDGSGETSSSTYPIGAMFLVFAVVVAMTLAAGGVQLARAALRRRSDGRRDG